MLLEDKLKFAENKGLEIYLEYDNTFTIVKWHENQEDCDFAHDFADKEAAILAAYEEAIKET